MVQKVSNIVYRQTVKLKSVKDAIYFPHQISVSKKHLNARYNLILNFLCIT